MICKLFFKLLNEKQIKLLGKVRGQLINQGQRLLAQGYQPFKTFSYESLQLQLSHHPRMNFPYMNQQHYIPINMDPSLSYGQQSYNIVVSVYPQQHCLNFQTFWPVANYNIGTPISPQQHLPPVEPSSLQENSPPSQQTTRKSRKQCHQKQLESARKNSESNLINQLLAFLNNPQQSQRLVNSCIKKFADEGCSEQKVRAIFYNVVRLLNLKRGRKYVNRSSLLRYYRPDSFLEQIPKIKDVCSEPGSISLENLCKIFRACTYTFLREYSINSVLTSRRISSIARIDHLRRRRKVVKSLAGQDELE